jgi:hypothetical protein
MYLRDELSISVYLRLHTVPSTSVQETEPTISDISRTQMQSTPSYIAIHPACSVIQLAVRACCRV